MPSILKIKNTPALSFVLAYIALSAVQISYVLGGVELLDDLLWLLVPAFLIYVLGILKSLASESKDYGMALVMVTACIIFSLFVKYPMEVGYMDDNYHNAKMVALSIRNDFFTQFQYVNPDGLYRYYLSEFIESVWGIFWRHTQWDFTVNLLQALPILVLWQQLVCFFRNQKITDVPALLAALVVMSLEVLWCSQGSTYIDSSAGILGGMAVLLGYDLLSFPALRNGPALAGLVFVCGLCLISKATVLPIAVIGMAAAVILSLKSLSGRTKVLALLSPLPSLIYFLYFHWQISLKHIDPIHPVGNYPGRIYQGMFHYYYTCFPGHDFVRDHLWNLLPFHIVASWLEDLVLVRDLTPDPWIGGNGLLFAYVVVPVLVLWIIKEFRHLQSVENWQKPPMLIFGLVLLYYLNFDGSVGSRFSLGYNVLVLAWCLAWLWRKLQQFKFKQAAAVRSLVLGIWLWMAVGSYLDANQASFMEKSQFSYLYAQREVFPQQIDTPEIKKFYLQQMQMRP